MSEKVLGFKKENALILPEIKLLGLSVPRIKGKSEFKEPLCIYIEKKDLVPVHLKSESVSLQELKEWCKENEEEITEDLPMGRGYSSNIMVNLEDLLSWAEEEASKKNE